MRSLVALALLAACSAPAKRAASASPQAPAGDPVEYTWIVEDHLRVKGASISDADAAAFHGRTVVAVPPGFSSPWQPACSEARRDQRDRGMSELFRELEISESGATKAASFGMTSDIIEYRLTCVGRATPMFIWVGGTRAMTCFSGACYLMKRFED